MSCSAPAIDEQRDPFKPTLWTHAGVPAALAIEASIVKGLLDSVALLPSLSLLAGPERSDSA
jgi:hypothetical protein